MQQSLAGIAESILSDQLKSKVSIGSVNLGFLNRIIIDDIVVLDPHDEEVATIARATAGVNLLSLCAGEINITSAQLFGVKTHLHRPTPDGEPNFQFLLEAFASKDDKPSAPVHLNVGALIVRNVDVDYDILSAPRADRRLDMNHLHLRSVGFNLSVTFQTDDSLCLSIKRLRGKEANSQLAIRDAQLLIAANRDMAQLSNCHVALPHSHIDIPYVHADYRRFASEGAFNLSTAPISSRIDFRDLAPLFSQAEKMESPMLVTCHINGNEKHIEVADIDIESTDKDIVLKAKAWADNILVDSARAVHAEVERLHLGSAKARLIADALQVKEDSLIHRLGHIDMSGEFHLLPKSNMAANADIILSEAGHITCNATMSEQKQLKAAVTADDLNIGLMLPASGLGTTSLSIESDVNLSTTKPFPQGTAEVAISHLNYNGYNFRDIRIEAETSAETLRAQLDMRDENAVVALSGSYADAATKRITLVGDMPLLALARTHLIKSDKDETVALSVDADLAGSDWQHLLGHINLSDIQISTADNDYPLGDITVSAQPLEGGRTQYAVMSDMVKADITGQVNLQDLTAGFANQIAKHLPLFIRQKPTADLDFDYSLQLSESPVLHYLTSADFYLNSPVKLYGTLCSSSSTMTATLDAPSVTYNGQAYDNISLACSSTPSQLKVHAIANSLKESYDDEVPSESMTLDVTADVHSNRVASDIYLNTNGRNNIAIHLLPTVQFKDSIGKTKTDIELRPSHAVINDTTWTVSPSSIELYGKDIVCHNVRFANNSNSYLNIDGKATADPEDALVVDLKDVEIKYILSLIDFDAVRFAGKTSGTITMNNVMAGDNPDLSAKISVKNLTIQEGPLGDAEIKARWDSEIKGIAVDGRMVDLYAVQESLTGNERSMTGVTTVSGWISPAKNDMKLDIDTRNTNAAFLHGFLGGVFKEINGHVSGPISVIGPLNDVNIVGKAVPNLNLRLRATNVPYHIEGDTISLQPYLFDFRNISLFDRFGHESVLNGRVTHKNMKNFKYDFDVKLHELLAYDEKEFNSDKFLATVFADGSLSISGSDGHPLYVKAQITPTRGSVFAYDAATPDAITTSSFITFHDRDSLTSAQLSPTAKRKPAMTDVDREKDSLAIIKEAKKNYNSDIYIDFDIDLTPACEVKLRMDNLDDGYMRTFGNAKLSAKWYNKGAFQLFGNYNISSGSYRLYLQDIIFRDLALQPGSVVEFNGNPFDANIHLVCHHTINSVPLSDLTATTAFSQNNKAKVVCILDITGKLGNMDFKFGMDLPNVNEETKQLVRSMINSEEEMNTQMIYLLGLGRFYPNEYIRNNGGGNSGQAMNSLLSSTLSGQINQMISNVIGTQNNWNFSSSLTTGEKGWDDLDVEGTLSGRLFDDRILINGAFGYRDNAMTNQGNFIGDFEVKWRLNRNGDIYLKAYNQTNDRYFTKATLNTQGLGISLQHNFEAIRARMKKKKDKSAKDSDDQ